MRFKVGDRIRVTSNRGIYFGRVGYIVAVSSYSEEYTVRLDGDNGDITGGRDTNLEHEFERTEEQAEQIEQPKQSFQSLDWL